MAGSNLRKFTNPGFLRALEFSNLIKLLRKFDGYFSGVVHFEYDGIEHRLIDEEMKDAASIINRRYI